MILSKVGVPTLEIRLLSTSNEEEEHASNDFSAERDEKRVTQICEEREIYLEQRILRRILHRIHHSNFSNSSFLKQ